MLYIYNLIFIMRLWSIHPKYLDSIWLIACWREWLLALNVLKWNTVWYRNHPQLNRFKSSKDPILAINAYLTQIFLEAERRWFKFNSNKINISYLNSIISVTTWQLEYEMIHLRSKLKIRNPGMYENIKWLTKIENNSIFQVIDWWIESFEKTSNMIWQI